MSLLDALLLDPAPFEVWIAKRTDGIKGCGTVSDPFNGSTQALFDTCMSGLPAGTRVHLGPGVFETKGYPNSGGWQIKAGMKITGAGMAATTLKLVNPDPAHNYAIGHDATQAGRADLAEVSDLTIDCNLAPAGYTIHGAVRLMGDQVRIHRVKAIHWGSGAETGALCTVFSIVTADPEGEVPGLADGGIEDCLAVEPSYTSGIAVAFHVGGVEGESFTREYHGRSPYIRNCHVDGGSVSGLSGISATWCRGGLVEGNHVFNADLGIAHTGRSSRDLIVRNNFLKNVSRGILLESGLASSLGAGELMRSGGVATIDEIATASLQVGDRVRLTTSEPETFSGVYAITAIMDTDSFTVTTPVTTETADVLAVYPVRSAARLIVEGNLIELATDDSEAAAVVVDDQNDSSPYPEAPDYVHGDITIRNNKVRYVDGATPDDGGALLMDVSGAKHLIVKDNVLDTIATLPLQNRRCGHATYFNNRTPGGVLVRGWDDELDRKYDELETEAEDALVLALFRKH